MPKLLSRSKHEEFESNSALQIRDQKERREENISKLEHLRNLVPAGHCSSCSTIHPSSQCSPLLQFDVVTFLLHFFGFFPFCPCNN